VAALRAPHTLRRPGEQQYALSALKPKILGGVDKLERPIARDSSLDCLQHSKPHFGPKGLTVFDEPNTLHVGQEHDARLLETATDARTGKADAFRSRRYGVHTHHAHDKNNSWQQRLC
jgi:hypothetical protein